MAVQTTAVTVATTATLIATGGSGAGRSAGSTIYVKPAVAGTGDSVFLGGSDVTTANGLPLGTQQNFYLNDDEELYGIVASSTVAVRVLESGV